MNEWLHKGYVEWETDDIFNISVVFSWDIQRAFSRAVYARSEGKRVRIGGPAALLQPNIFDGVAKVGGVEPNAVLRHNPLATFTTRGCINKCGFCIVPKIEPEFRELSKDEWEPNNIICDNNLLAASIPHFDEVIDRLKEQKWVDFNQGLDARLLTRYHADRLSELRLLHIRLAWDDISLENDLARAIEILQSAGIPKRKITIYVLIGFNDDMQDALYRLNTVRKVWKVTPFPMRFQPLKTERRNLYVSPKWEEHQEKRDRG